ncbi:MAG: hypothetical protein IPN42_15280 [Methylococcaceae bacterium]|nr:hypothetical protein [Methylococcaceae bacterium]
MLLLNKKTVLLTASVLSISAFAGLASAHCLTGRTLAAATSAVDLYRVKCFDDGPGNADHIDALINNEAGGASVRAQIAREGFRPSGISTDSTSAATNCAAATNITLDPNDPVTQPGTTAVNGNGDYNILVNKTSSTAKTYGLVFHCETSGNVETGTSEVHAGSAAPELAGNAALGGDIDLIIDQ